jgi:hypothetical protein
MVKSVLFVEGGGHQNPSLASECRRAFSKLLESAGVRDKPRVVACGSRAQAYEQFCAAQATSEAHAWLLVDAEELPPGGTAQSPWEHVRANPLDRWSRPPNASDLQLHLMTACMEAWLVSDHNALEAVFGNKLDKRKLPKPDRIESIEKSAVFSALQAATSPTTSGGYRKGVQRSRVLALISPAALRKLAWGERFLDTLGAHA